MNSSQFIEQNLSFPLTLPSSVTSQYPIEHALHSSSGSMITSLKDLSRHIRLLFEKNKHFDIILHGNLIETRFDSSTLKPVLITQLSLNQVAYIHDSIGLHCIANPSPSPSVSLHVYFPPIHECLIYHPITMCTSKSICNNYQSNACAGIPQS
ncbi:hypothetical protein HMI55_005275 [Coelomomyces lativittatus]|nr:hypothetical protein HMI55_005275 [Coelomomyces lativittatus]